MSANKVHFFICTDYFCCHFRDRLSNLIHRGVVKCLVSKPHHVLAVWGRWNSETNGTCGFALGENPIQPSGIVAACIYALLSTINDDATYVQ